MNKVTRLLSDITKNVGLNRAEIALLTTVSRWPLQFTYFSSTKYRYCFLGTTATGRSEPRIFE